MRSIHLMAGLLLASACHRSQPAQGPFETAGKGLDTATDKTGHALTNATDRTGHALTTAAQKTGEGVTAAGRATGKAFTKVGDKLQGNDAPAPASTAH